MDVLYLIAKQHVARNNTIYIILFYSVRHMHYAKLTFPVHVLVCLKDNTAKQTKEPKVINSIPGTYIQFSC